MGACELGGVAATAIVVGTIIGSGIFLVPSEMMRAVGSPGLVYLAWVLGGILSFLGALTYAELGAMKPDAGGEYVYVRDAYGPLMGFMYAWTTLLISKPGSIASMVTGMVRILGTFAAFSFLGATSSQGPLRRNGWATSRDFHCRVHLFHQLHRREESRRVPGCIHSSEGGDRRRSHSCIVLRGARHMVELRHAL